MLDWGGRCEVCWNINERPIFQFGRDEVRSLRTEGHYHGDWWYEIEEVVGATGGMRFLTLSLFEVAFKVSRSGCKIP